MRFWKKLTLEESKELRCNYCQSKDYGVVLKHQETGIVLDHRCYDFLGKDRSKYTKLFQTIQ